MLSKLWLAGQAVGCTGEDLQNACNEQFGAGLRDITQEQLQTLVEDYTAWRDERKAGMTKKDDPQV